MRNDGMNCETLQRTMRDGRELTKEESAHLDECDACMDVWLTQALDAKPEVMVPADFAARVAAKVPVRQQKQPIARMQRSWGLATAMAVVTVLLVVCFRGPGSASSWLGLVFLFLVTAEIAGLALWLGPRWMGR
jgi:predicted anti-sigma-YlaC factor YlaD